MSKTNQNNKKYVKKKDEPKCLYYLDTTDNYLTLTGSATIPGLPEEFTMCMSLFSTQFRGSHFSYTV